MSEESWKAEFYPIPADRVSKEDALEHSLRKHIGARPANLKKHGLSKVPLHINCDTCALCQIYRDDEADDCCVKCSVVQTGGLACCEIGSAFDRSYAGVNEHNPEPMIAELERVKAALAKGKP